MIAISECAPRPTKRLLPRGPFRNRNLWVDRRNRRRSNAVRPPPPQEGWQDREGVNPRQPEVGRLDPFREEHPLRIRNPGGVPGSNDLRDQRVWHGERRNEDRKVQTDGITDVEE